MNDRSVRSCATRDTERNDRSVSQQSRAYAPTRLQSQGTPCALSCSSVLWPSRTSKRTGVGVCSILVSGTLLSTPHPLSVTSPHPLCSVAIKSIPKSELFSAEAVQDEIETLRTVRHTNVMELLDVFEDRKNVHIVTPLYEGGELFDAITLRGRYTFSESDAASIVRQILLALECCWDSDIAHRDIKPENILFKKKAAAEGSSGGNNSSDGSSSSSNSDSGSSSDSSSGGNSSRRSSGGVAVPDEVADGTFDDLVLVDFGMARKHVPESRPMVAQVGSPSYVAPEVLKGTGYVTASVTASVVWFQDFM